MATPTYELIDSTTLTSSASSVTFSSITQDYRDLVLVLFTGNDSGFSRQIYVTLNNDTGSNYSYVSMAGDGSTAFSFSGTTDILVQSGDDIRTKDLGDSQWIVQLMDYSATDKHKTALTRFTNFSGAGDSATAVASRWANTAAITEIDVEINNTTFSVGSTFSLYGIAS